MQINSSFYTFIPNTLLQNATAIYLSYSHRLPSFDFRRLQSIEVILVYNESNRMEVHAASFYYYPKRLYSPYIADCIQYRNENGKYSTRLDIVTRCANLKRLNELKYLWLCQYFTINDKIFLNESVLTYPCNNKWRCFHRYIKPDCDQMVHFTSISKKPVSSIFTHQPFFYIYSSPSIDP